MSRTLLFCLLFILLPLSSVFAAAPPAPVPATGQTITYEIGDDGNLQKGIQWPDPRFTDNDDGTVTDNLTGLIWLKYPTLYNCFNREMPWPDALAAANALADGSCSLPDSSKAGAWRLPNINELESLSGLYMMPEVRPFTMKAERYWSSTTDVTKPTTAWTVDMLSGAARGDSHKTYQSHWVWPVRGGQ